MRALSQSVGGSTRQSVWTIHYSERSRHLSEHVVQFVDTHAHLDEPAFEPDLDGVVANAVAAGVGRIVTIGTTAESSRRAVEVASRFEPVYAVVGVQPNYVAETKPGDWETIVELASAPKVVGLGETGLDRYWDHAPFEQQVDWFRRHLDLARERELPFVVHCREAEADVVAELRRAAGDGPLAGIMHSFCGDAATAEACLELGLHLSFAGMLTYKKSGELRDVAARVPADRLLIETDAPYLVPHEIRKRKKAPKRNEPAFVRHTAECLADARGEPLEKVAASTTANAIGLFALPT